MRIEAHYEDARRYPDIRQEFLKEVNMEDYAQYVRKMEYIEKIPGVVMRTFAPAIGTPDFPLSRIAVSGEAFDDFSWNEFYNILVHHEGFHAEYSYKNPMSCLDVIICLASSKIGLKSKPRIAIHTEEIAAYLNQMRHPSFKECSPRFKKKVWDYLQYYKDELTKLNRRII